MKGIHSLFPAIENIRNYGLSKFKGDMIAGIVVGIVLIPQGMAYAVIAGLPPIYGLYAGLIPLVIYPLLGKSTNLAIGPVALDMLILSAGLGLLAGDDLSQKIYYAVIITSTTGLIQLLMGGLRLGLAFNLIARPVVSGFTIAAPIIIIVSQLGTLFGIELPGSQFIFTTLEALTEHISDYNTETVLSSVAFLSALILIKKISSRIPSSVIVVIITLGLVPFVSFTDFGIEQIGAIPEGLPEFRFEFLTLSEFKNIFSTAVTIALIQFMTIASLAKTYSRKNGSSEDPNQELIALGSANFFGGLFQSPPVSSSFSRSAIADEVGAKTPFFNVISALMILLTLLYLTSVFEQLPKNLLSAIIVISVWGLIDIKEVKYLFTAKKRDGLVALVTFSGVLFVGIQEGIIIGISASVIAILIKLAKPTVAELGFIPGTKDFRNIERFEESKTLDDILILRIDASFSFVNAGFFKKYILNKSQDKQNIRFVIIDGTTISDLDISAMESLSLIIEDLDKQSIKMMISGLIGPVRDVINKSEHDNLGDEDRFHRTLHEAVIDALKRLDKEDSGDRLNSFLSESDQ